MNRKFANFTDTLLEAFKPWRICAQCLGFWPGWGLHTNTNNKYSWISFAIHLALTLDIVTLLYKIYLDCQVKILTSSYLFFASYSILSKITTFIIIIHTWLRSSDYINYMKKFETNDIFLKKYSNAIWRLGWCSNGISIGIITLVSVVTWVLTFHLIAEFKSTDLMYHLLLISTTVTRMFEFFGILFFYFICLFFYTILYYSFVEFSVILEKVLLSDVRQINRRQRTTKIHEVLYLCRKKHQKLSSLTEQANELFSPVLFILIVSHAYILCTVLYQTMIGTGLPRFQSPFLIGHQVIGITTRFLCFVFLCVTGTAVHKEVRWQRFSKFIASNFHLFILLYEMHK